MTRNTQGGPGGKSVTAPEDGVAPERDIIDTTINGCKEEPVVLGFDAVNRQAEENLDAHLALTACETGVEVAPLRAVLSRVREAGVPEAEISNRLSSAADELIELRARLSWLGNQRREIATVCEPALALINRGDLDGACSALLRGQDQAAANFRRQA